MKSLKNTSFKVFISDFIIIHDFIKKKTQIKLGFWVLSLGLDPNILGFRLVKNLSPSLGLRFLT